MKLEKIKKYKSPRLQWGLLSSTPVSESFLKTLPVLIANDFQDPLTLQPKINKASSNLYLQASMGGVFEGYSDEAAYIFDKYTAFRHSSFIEFFEKNSIDVPKCFKSTNSLRRSTFELFFLRFSNYLMKQGKKEKVFVTMHKAFHSFFALYKKNTAYTDNLQLTNWAFLHFAFNTVGFTRGQYTNFFYRLYGNTLNNHFIKEGHKYYVHTSDLLSILSKLLSIVQPLFHFSLYSLDKRARKSGRKKASKYIFIWKYVPTYKRKALLLKLIANNIKFNQGHTLKSRLEASLDTLYKDPQNSHVVQTNRFAHHYVFKNFRRSLLTNFKMTA